MVQASTTDGMDLWLNRRLPDDLLVEFDFTPGNPDSGLVILWFCATGPAGQSVFDLSMERRDCIWPRYHSGQLRCYHTSFWATEPWNLDCRGTNNLRKDPPHRLVAIGHDNIAGRGPGPHRVRLARLGSRIQLETNGELAVVWDDADKALGEPYPGGYLAIHHMHHTGWARYADFVVHEVV
jgi:hypothetical protein